jgi:quinol monooxygenase YgiN
MAVVVVATIRPLPDHRAEVIAAMEAVIARVHAEDDGCLLYALHEGPDRLVMIEKWSSQEALTAHLRAPALTSLLPQLDGLLEAPADIQTLQPHPAGTPGKGAL